MQGHYNQYRQRQANDIHAYKHIGGQPPRGQAVHKITHRPSPVKQEGWRHGGSTGASRQADPQGGQYRIAVSHNNKTHNSSSPYQQGKSGCKE